MKNLIFLVAAFLTLGLVSCDKQDVNPTTDGMVLAKKAPVVIDPSVANDLLVLREEEKLARDVYTYAFAKYGTSIFNNISQSEQVHMDKVLQLITSLNLPDPASPQAGVFNNAALQTLYNALIAKVDLSLMDALEVGATIEDMDIYDIMNFEASTTDPVVLTVLGNLRNGSYNHLRSFHSLILAHNGTYIPQYISQTLFDSIISSGTGGGGPH